MEPLVPIFLGFGLGFLIGLTGVGGGALVAPALYVILGLEYGPAVAISLVYSIVTKIFGAVQHIRQGTVQWRITLLYGLTGIPGAVLGSRLIYGAGADLRRALPFVMGALLLVVAALLFVEAAVDRIARREKPFSPHRIAWPGALAIAGFQLVVGLLMGVTSVGSGSLVIVSMVYFFQMSAREIVGSNLVMAFMMVVPAGVTHSLSGGVDWGLLALLLLGSVGGAVLGARTTMVLPERVLKLSIVCLIVAGAVATIAKAWRG